MSYRPAPELGACARCPQPLARVPAHGFSHWPCAACRGSWVARRDLASLLVDEPRHPPGDAGASPLAPPTCPTCRAALVAQVVRDVTLHACDIHGAWFDGDGAERLLTQLFAETRFGDCPACRGELVDVLALGYRYQRCARCRGVWADRAALDGLMESINPGEPPLEAATGAPRGRACPTCHSPMTLARFGGEAIDVCVAGHGHWFDAHELARALARHAGLAG